MADTTEIERLLVRLVGDNKLYVETLKEAEKRTQEFTQSIDGRWRDAQGKYVAYATVMQAKAGAQLQKLYALGEGFKHVGEQAIKAGRAMTSFGMSMSLRVTAPLTVVGVAAAKTFGDFEQVMGQMQGLAGVAASEIGGISEAVKQLSLETGKGPTELAESMYNIRSSGVAGQTALDTLTVSAKAAAAGLGETRVVSDAVTSAINAYGAENMSAARATDILVATVREGKAEADEIAPVMGRLIPVASAMGIQFEEVAGVMAVMSRTGSDAAEASVSIGAIMNTLLKPSKEATEVLRSAGISMGELRDKAAKPGGLIEVMRILDRTFGDNEEALSTIVPETRAFRGVMNVLAQDAELVDGVMRNVANSVGATEEAFAAGAGTVNRTWGQMMSQIKTALIELGELVKPVMIAIMDRVTAMVEWFKTLDKGTQNIIIVIGGLAAAVGPVLTAFGLALTIFGTATKAIGTLMASAKLLILTLGAVKLALAGLAVGGITLLVMGAYKAIKALSGMDAELKKIQQTAAKFNMVVDERFTRDMEALAELPVDKQREELEIMKKNLEGNVAATKKIIEQHKAEIEADRGKTLHGGTSVLGDLYGNVAQSEAHLADAEQRAAQFASQLDVVKSQLKAVGDASQDAGEEIMGTLRPGAIEDFTKQMEASLRNLEIEHKGTKRGQSNEEIQRAQAMAALNEELRVAGAALTNEERLKLQAMQMQMGIRERELEKLKEAKKEEEKIIKEKEKAQEDMAKKAEDVIKGSMTPIQELKSQIEEIRELEKAGALSKQESKLAQDRLVGDFAAANKVDKASAGAAIEFGSAESQANRLQQTQKSTEKGVWAMVEEAKINNRKQDDILFELRNPKDEELVGIPG